ncbi:MAG: nodulation protein NfeD [Thermodesulfobacteriota bacterium]|nr:nodulation protein NfeD [Thermodesulfobacteriota bacterium]
MMRHHFITNFSHTVFTVFFCPALLIIAITLLAHYPVTTGWAQKNEPSAFILEVKGAIGPGVSDFVRRGLEKAEKSKARVFILQLDTPGGLDLAMREIIQDILASPVPVVTYVAPSGARAASAGTYILYASHVAAMAPATNLGAATPVTIGSLPGMDKGNKNGDTREGDKEKKSQGNTLKQKMINDAEAYIISLAEKHGRNRDWAAKAVRESVSISAEEALRLGVIDLMADNIDELLARLNGREVLLTSGPHILHTSNLGLVHMEKDWRTRLMMVISDPNIAYMLMLLGIYGLFFELANPGYVLPGVVGGTALLLALYAFQVLPVNYAGLALIVLGISFMVAEAFTPSFGVLGMGGLAAFVFGSVILIDEKSLQVSLFLIGSIALISFACILWLVGKLLIIRNKRVRTGRELMLDSIGEVMDDFTVNGRVRILGESWQASSATPLKKGDKVRIIAQEGLQLSVELLQEVE